MWLAAAGECRELQGSHGAGACRGLQGLAPCEERGLEGAGEGARGGVRGRKLRGLKPDTANRDAPFPTTH